MEKQQAASIINKLRLHINKCVRWVESSNQKLVVI